MEHSLKSKWYLISLGYLIILAGCNNAASEKQTSDERNPSKEVVRLEPKESPILNYSKFEGIPSDIKIEKSLLDKAEKKKNPNTIKPSLVSPKVAPNIKSELPDFTKYKNTINKKKAFFAFLEPIIINENIIVIGQRNYILSQMKFVNDGNVLKSADSVALEELAIKYRVFYNEVGSEDFFDGLLLHVDIIPIDLALAQAANESAWGSSYFARRGNNLFGQWCFTPGCGLVPRKRHKDDTHEVAVFDNLTQSVASYIQYLNSHPAFKKLRQERYQARIIGKAPSGYDMATGLKAYSARGMKYVRTLQSMIKKNKKYMGLSVVDQKVNRAKNQ